MDKAKGNDDSTPIDHNLLAGAAILNLIADPTRWVHRRVETVEFLNTGTFLRTVRVEFTMPKSLPGLDATSRLLPLAFLSKRRRVIELFDEANQSVPFLTKTENQALAWAVLRAAARSAVVESSDEHSEGNPGEDSLPSEVLLDLRTICEAGPRDAVKRLEDLLGRGDDLARALNSSAAFKVTARSLAEGFLFIAVISGDVPQRRRIFELRYREFLQWPIVSATRSWGWEPIPFAFDCPGILEAQAYHFIAVAPPGLAILEGAIWEHPPRREPYWLAYSEDGGSRIHLYQRGARQRVFPQDEPQARAWVWIAPPHFGLLRAASISSIISTLLLLTVLINIGARGKAPAAATSVLLAIPSAVSIFIVRPGENSFTSQVLLGLRTVIALSGLFPFAAAVFTALRLSDSVLWCAWLSVSAGAACCSLILGIAYRRRRVPLLHDEEE